MVLLANEQLMGQLLGYATLLINCVLNGFMNCIVVVSIFFDDAKRGKSKYSGT